MNVEGIINEIEWLETLFKLPDNRQPKISERRKANRQNAATDRLEKLFSLPDERPEPEETRTHDPRFRLWRPADV